MDAASDILSAAADEGDGPPPPAAAEYVDTPAEKSVTEWYERSAVCDGEVC